MARFWFSGPRILGIRPGISFSPNDFKSRPSTRQRNEYDPSSFVYVIKAPNDRVKIGVTKNPSARLKALQTGSHMRLRFAFIGCTPGEGYDIERAAHDALFENRLEGEWFDVPAEKAIAVVTACAWKLHHPLEIVSQAQADTALAIAANDGMPPERASFGIILLRLAASILLTIIAILAVFVITAIQRA